MCVCECVRLCVVLIGDVGIQFMSACERSFTRSAPFESAHSENSCRFRVRAFPSGIAVPCSFREASTVHAVVDYAYVHIC